MCTEIIAQKFSEVNWLDANLPSDWCENDPRWQQVEIAEGVFMWQWRPATIEYANGEYAATVGARIERFPALEAAEWWCEEVMDVVPVVRSIAPVAVKVARAAVHVAALAVSFAVVFLAGMVL